MSERRSRAAVGGLSSSAARAREAMERGAADNPARLDHVLGCDRDALCQRWLAPVIERGPIAIDPSLERRECAEALWSRGLLSDDWLEDSRAIEPLGMSDAEALVAIARMGAWVATVEALAYESFGRARETPPARVCWRVGPAARIAPPCERRPFSDGRSARFRPGTTAASDELTQPLRARASDGEQRWIDAFEQDVRRYWSWTLSGREYRKNPYTPLCEAWVRGAGIEQREDGAIGLWLPWRVVQ